MIVALLGIGFMLSSVENQGNILCMIQWYLANIILAAIEREKQRQGRHGNKRIWKIVQHNDFEWEEKHPMDFPDSK